jgi:hypothetical protein
MALNERNRQRRQKLWKTARTLAGFCALAAMLLLAAPRLSADDHNQRCRRDMEKAEARYDEAVSKHGEHSAQAEERRHQLHEIRERCWNENHEWWNGRDHQWHKDRDWDHD